MSNDDADLRRLVNVFAAGRGGHINCHFRHHKQTLSIMHTDCKVQGVLVVMKQLSLNREKSTWALMYKRGVLESAVCRSAPLTSKFLALDTPFHFLCMLLCLNSGLAYVKLVLDQEGSRFHNLQRTHPISWNITRKIPINRLLFCLTEALHLTYCDTLISYKIQGKGKVASFLFSLILLSFRQDSGSFKFRILLIQARKL